MGIARVGRSNRPNPQHGRLTDHTAVKQLLGFDKRGIIQEILGDAERAVGSRQRLGNRVHLSNGRGDRFLTRHVLTGIESGDDLGRMQVRRG